jgi:hypothetical protein
MVRIIAVFFGFAALGVALAVFPIGWPLRAGYMGAVVIVALAWLARVYWRRRAATSGDDPSITERRAWLYMAGTAMICGYVIVVLATPGSEVHRATGDTGGIDSWLMLGGGAIAWVLLHTADNARDERDAAIDAAANRVGYTALVILLVIFLLALGFAPKPTMQRFTHWLIANSLLTLIMLAALAQYVAMLYLYWKDRRAAHAHDAISAKGS